METRNKFYYNYEDEEEAYYEEDENYDGYNNYDDLLDFIIDNLQRYGCNHCIDEIEEFLTNFGDITLAEWSRDLMDPSISDFTCNYIIELMNQKYSIPIKITPPINNDKMKTSTSLQKNKKSKVQADKTCKTINDNKIGKVFTKELKIKFQKAAFQQWRAAIKIPSPIEVLPPLVQTKMTAMNAPASHVKKKAMEKKSTIFTKELKAAFTKAAFQQWKIVIQASKIQDAKIRLKQESATTFEKNWLDATAPAYQPEQGFQ